MPSSSTRAGANGIAVDRAPPGARRSAGPRPGSRPGRSRGPVELARRLVGGAHRVANLDSRIAMAAYHNHRSRRGSRCARRDGRDSSSSSSPARLSSAASTYALEPATVTARLDVSRTRGRLRDAAALRAASSTGRACAASARARRRGRGRRPRGRPARDRRRGAAQPLRRRGRCSTSAAWAPRRARARRCRSSSSAGPTAPASARSAASRSTTPSPGAHDHEREPDPRWAKLRELSVRARAATRSYHSARRWPSRRSEHPAPAATSGARTHKPRHAAPQRVPALPQPAAAAPRLPDLRHLRRARGDRARDRRAPTLEPSPQARSRAAPR